MRDEGLYNKRNELIYEYYCTRWGDGFRDTVILKELQDQFFLSLKHLDTILRMMRKKSFHKEPEALQA